MINDENSSKEICRRGKEHYDSDPDYNKNLKEYISLKRLYDNTSSKDVFNDKQ